MKQLQLNNLLATTTSRLVAACVIIHLLFSGAQGQEIVSMFALHSSNHPDFHYWQLLSYMFLHGGLTHLALNMIALWSFGHALEAMWGGKRFLLFFLLCGVGAGVVQLFYCSWQFNSLHQVLLHLGISEADIAAMLESGSYPKAWLTDISEQQIVEIYRSYNASTVGASGSIYGVLVAYMLLFPNNKLIFLFLPYPVPAKYFVPVILIIDLLSGLAGVSIFGYNIAHFAHLGGALTGFILMLYWRQTLQRTRL